jgi:transposase-like protein
MVSNTTIMRSRDNEDINQRYKIMRHFKSFESASAFLEMKRIIHNFVNPHMELEGATPAEMAGFGINLGENKLLSLIKWCYLTKT